MAVLQNNYIFVAKQGIEKVTFEDFCFLFKNRPPAEEIIIKASIRYLIEKDLFEIKESDDANPKYADIIEYVIKTEDIIKTIKEIFSKDIESIPELIIDNGYEYKKNDDTYIARLLNTDYIPEEYEYSANNVSKSGNYYIVNILSIKKNETMVDCQDDDCADAAVNENMEYELKYKLEGKIYKFISIKRVK